MTGTQICGRVPAGSTVKTIDRQAIEQSGYATTRQLLAALPQNFDGGATESSYTTGRNGADTEATFGSGVNLYGSGPSSTLVLLNCECPRCCQWRKRQLSPPCTLKADGRLAAQFLPGNSAHKDCHRAAW